MRLTIASCSKKIQQHKCNKQKKPAPVSNGMNKEQGTRRRKGLPKQEASFWRMNNEVTNGMALSLPFAALL